jgi:cobalamin synthase
MAYTNRKIGGVTGGILGANEQISEILFLLVFSSLYASM